LPAELTANKCFFQEAQRNRPQVVVTDGRVRNTGLVVRTRNSGENEANFLARRKFVETQSLKAIRRKMKMNLLTNKNVSRGQMGDQIVAIRAVFC
jgi:hypothetical protein